MLRAILILAVVVIVLLGALMALRGSKVPPPPANMKRYDDWEKEDEARGWKDKE